ncbi:TPA: hypothetical protein HA251_00835 [Candidatus Woesearchaeota archaeon]|nr:hypothetical protein [Candidatus Woesearchaeota archaeon]
MESRFILWDQDNFTLRGVGDNSDDYVINPTARTVLNYLADKGFTNVAYSNKSPGWTLAKAKAAKQDDAYAAMLDSRGMPGSKTVVPLQRYTGLDAPALADRAIYFGDNFNNDILYDCDGLVHVFDALGLKRDFHAYANIIDYLDSYDNTSFRTAYEGAWNRARWHDYKGVRTLFHAFDTKSIFSERENYADFDSSKMAETTNVISVVEGCLLDSVEK